MTAQPIASMDTEDRELLANDLVVAAMDKLDSLEDCGAFAADREIAEVLIHAGHHLAEAGWRMLAERGNA